MQNPLSLPVYDKYRYLIKSSWSVRLFYLLGIFTWLLAMYGFYRFLRLDPLYALVLGPMVFLLSAYYLLNYGVNLFYKVFDLPAHRQKIQDFWTARRGTEQTVDILLPICGEPLDIIERTFVGVKNLKHPVKTVYVLDDKGQNELKQLSERYGFRYLSRANKGEMKKAGNLKHGYENSTSEFIAIFDADFVPHEDFLQELLPYMDDPRTAIVQSPQYFQTDDEIHARSPIEFGAGYSQENFYRIAMRSRDAFEGAICVGTNAIYRRSALDVIGGTAQVERSEDVHTGFRLVCKGFRIRYIPIILAIGLCPPNLHAYFHQQHRWCAGSLGLMFSKQFWLSPLTIPQKLGHLAGFLHYIKHGISLIFALQIFVLLFRHFDWINLWNGLPFYPHILYTFIIMPLFRITKPKFGTFITGHSHNFIHLHALWRLLTGRPLEWKPAGSNMPISQEYVRMLHIKGLYYSLYIGLASLALAINHFPLFNVKYYSVLFWIIYSLIINGVIVYHAYKTAIDILRKHAIEKKDYRRWLVKNALPYAAFTVAAPVFALIFNVAHLQSPNDIFTDAPITSVFAATVTESTTEIIPSEKIQETVTPELVIYSITAKRGEGVIILARQATLAYENDKQLPLRAWERMYLETQLAEYYGQQAVHVGTTLTFDGHTIQSLLEQTAQQTGNQIRTWGHYARLAGMR